MSTSSKRDEMSWALWVAIALTIVVGAVARVVGRHHMREPQIDATTVIAEPEMLPVKIEVPEPASLPVAAQKDSRSQ